MKHYIFRFVALFFILTVAIPPVNLLLPLGESVRSGLVIVAVLLLFPGLLLKGTFLTLLLYIIEITLYYLSGNKFFNSINIVISTFAVIGSSVVMMEYILKYDKYYVFSRIVIFTIVIANILMSIISIPQLDIDPNIIRYIYTEGLNNENSLYRWHYFIISWGTITSLPFLFAPMVFLCKKSYKTNKPLFVFWLVSILLLFYIIYRSGVTTPMVVGAIMIVLGMVLGYERFNKKNVTRIVLVGLMAVLMTSPIVTVPVLTAIQSTMENEETSKRVDEIKEALVYGESGGDLGTRNDLYNQSFDLFIESPLAGTSYPEKIGKHSFFIDRLALHGALFIIPLLLFFVVLIKRVYRSLEYSKVIYILGVFSFLFMLAFKSDAYLEIWLYGIFILTVFCRYIDYTAKQSSQPRIVVKNKLKK